jgi:hypothetical protein
LVTNVGTTRPAQASKYAPAAADNLHRLAQIPGVGEVVGQVEDPRRGGGVAELGSRDPALTAELGGQQGRHDPKGRVRLRRRLDTAQARVVDAWVGRADENRAVGVDDNEGDANLVEPPDRFEGDAAGVAEHDETSEPVADPGVAAGTPAPPDAVGHDQVAVVDADVEAVAIGDADARG